jgi:hypothetical protein
MESTWTPHGLHTNYIKLAQIYGKVCMDSTWTPHGLHNSTWSPCGVQENSMGHSKVLELQETENM